MSEMVDQAAQERLLKLFGDDVTFDRIERKLYSHDVGSVPRLIRPFMPGGLAGGVVRPRDEDSLVALVQLARERGLQLVPRGAATSGYGGVIPPEGALVVDMRRWKRVLAVDAEGMTVTVEAGVVWKDLEPILAEHDLSLRLYPTSSPSSTVAGWLAQGGSGHGSYRYGWFKDNVVSARVVLPTGEVREFTADELDTIADAEGTTGFITQVTLKVQPLSDISLFAASFGDARRLGAAMARIAADAVPLWSVSFINPAAVRLGKTLPAKTHHGHPIHAAHTPPDVPEAFTALFAWRDGDTASGGAASIDIEAALSTIVREAGGIELPAEVAEHEWELRFSPMRIKRIGPSLIPTEVVVPTGELGAALEDIDRDVDLPIVIEGVGVSGDEFVLLGLHSS